MPGHVVRKRLKESAVLPVPAVKRKQFHSDVVFAVVMNVRLLQEFDVDCVLRQGHEMGRPCRITIQFRKENEVLTHGGIGGHAVIVGEGVLDLEA